MKEEVPTVPCHIKSLSISCFGCCGNNFSSKKEVFADIEENTKELNSFGTKLSTDVLTAFRDRFGNEEFISESGLCFNFVNFGYGCSGCPLHKNVSELVSLKSDFKINNYEEDLRIGHCNVNEECQTFIMWKSMNEEEKIEFIKWLKEKEYDSYRYSVENGKEELMGFGRKVLKNDDFSLKM